MPQGVRTRSGIVPYSAPKETKHLEVFGFLLLCKKEVVCMKENTSIDESIYFASGIIKLHKYLTKNINRQQKSRRLAGLLLLGKKIMKKLKEKSN